MKTINWLTTQPTETNPHEIEDYPYWFSLRTSLFMWLETNKRGTRIVRQTLNPKTNKLNKPKKSVYYTFVRLFENEEGHIKSYVYNQYSIEDFLKAQKNGVFEGNEDQEAIFWENQRLLSIRGMVIYGGFELDLIKDLSLKQLHEISEDDIKAKEYKIEEAKVEGWSPFKTTSYQIG